MPSVYRPSGRRVWRIEFTDQHGQPKKVSSGLHDRKAAESLAQLIDRDAQRLRAGLPAEHADVTGVFLGLRQAEQRRPIDEAIQAYLNELVRRGTPPGSCHHRDARTMLDKLAAECSWQTVADVRPGPFTEFLGRLAAKGRAPRTQNHYLEVIRAFGNFCVQQEWLPKNPVENVSAVKVGQAGRRRLRRPFTWDEFQRLLAATNHPAIRLCYTVAAFSGFRKSELRRLTREDCTPVGPRPRWHVDARRTKNGQAVRLPMVPECAEALREHWLRLPPGARLLQVPRWESVNHHIHKAGIAPQDERGRWVDFHCLRYTFCLWLSKHFPIEVVSKLMRHGTLELTNDIYLDLGLDLEGENGWTLPRITPGATQTRAEKEAG
jgi:integrase